MKALTTIPQKDRTRYMYLRTSHPPHWYVRNYHLKFMFTTWVSEQDRKKAARLDERTAKQWRNILHAATGISLDIVRVPRDSEKRE